MLETLRLRNFTAFPVADLKFGKHLNIIVGENGLGKTHLLKNRGGIRPSCSALRWPAARAKREFGSCWAHWKKRWMETRSSSLPIAFFCYASCTSSSSASSDNLTRLAHAPGAAGQRHPQGHRRF